MSPTLRRSFVRLLLAAAFACGCLGVVVGILDREFKLAVTGYFTGGTLLGVLAIAIMIDGYLSDRADREEYARDRSDR